eukprot:s787_g6.t1
MWHDVARYVFGIECPCAMACRLPYDTLQQRQTVAGTGRGGFGRNSYSSLVQTFGVETKLSASWGLALDGTSRLYIADSRKITPFEAKGWVRLGETSPSPRNVDRQASCGHVSAHVLSHGSVAGGWLHSLVPARNSFLAHVSTSADRETAWLSRRDTCWLRLPEANVFK